MATTPGFGLGNAGSIPAGSAIQRLASVSFGACKALVFGLWGFKSLPLDHNKVSKLGAIAPSHMSRWYESKEKIENALVGASSMAEVLRRLGLHVSSGNYDTLKKWCRVHDLTLVKANPKHFVPKRESQPLDEILVKDSKCPRGTVKRRLLATGMLRNECYVCGLGDTWQGKPISHQLDHINGVNNDHRFENLRMICPNCHAQTPTYAGRNKEPKSVRTCLCGNVLSSGSKMGSCRTCSNKSRKGKNTKITWPPTEDLLKMLDESNFAQVARELGVSDNAIRKRIKNHA